MEPRQDHHPAPTHYTVFVRLPFPRNGFEDPEPVQWDSMKDQALWKLISKASNSKEIDWEAMSLEFGVTLSFLLQQAAWLYERHFEGMKLQMKRLGAAGGSTIPASPRPGTANESLPAGSGITSAGYPMTRTGSKDSAARSSAINTIKSAGQPYSDTGSASATPKLGRPDLSRIPSNNTVTQSRTYHLASRGPLQRTSKGAISSSKTSPLPPPALDSSREDVESVESREAHSNSASSSDHVVIPRATTTRKPQIGRQPFKNAVMSSEDDGEGEDEEGEGSGGFLPFASTYKSTREDPSATLRNSPKRPAAQPASKRPLQPPVRESSASSSTDRRDSEHSRPAAVAEKPGALSPRHRAQLEHLSPRYKRSGSEGSPSMGSSFSDLDDASVTQSALEDALLSNMQHGSIGLGIGSRMSSLRETLGRK